MGLNALTYFVLIVMLAPMFWLVARRRRSRALSSGSYDLLYPSFDAFSDMWNAVDFEQVLHEQLVICTRRGAVRDGVREPAGYALAR